MHLTRTQETLVFATYRHMSIHQIYWSNEAIVQLRFEMTGILSDSQRNNRRETEIWETEILRMSTCNFVDLIEER